MRAYHHRGVCVCVVSFEKTETQTELCPVKSVLIGDAVCVYRFPLSARGRCRRAARYLVLGDGLCGVFETVGRYRQGRAGQVRAVGRHMRYSWLKGGCAYLHTHTQVWYVAAAFGLDLDISTVGKRGVGGDSFAPPGFFLFTERDMQSGRDETHALLARGDIEYAAKS